MAAFVSGREMIDSTVQIGTDTSCLLVFVKEHTRGFKETNFNVTKSIMELFLSLCDYHEKATCPFPKWAAADGATLCADKIADKKLSALSKALLTALCVVEAPHHILTRSFGAVGKIRAPAAHEEFLNWLKSFLNDFGAASIGQGLTETVTFLVEVRQVRPKKRNLHSANLSSWGPISYRSKIFRRVLPVFYFHCCNTGMQFKECESEKGRNGCNGCHPCAVRSSFPGSRFRRIEKRPKPSRTVGKGV